MSLSEEANSRGSGLSIRFCAAMLTFALHVASGIAYYFRFMYSFSEL